MGVDGDTKPDVNEDGERLEKIDVVVMKDGIATTLKVRPNTKFEKIFNAIETKFGVQPGTFRFVHEGQRIDKNDTPASLGIEHQDQIDAFLQQLGGSSRLALA